MKQGKPLTIGIAGYKGGTGKTTVAMHLAQAFAEEKLKVLLIDGDPNRSCENWAREWGAEGYFKVVTLRQAIHHTMHHEIVIFDTGARTDKEDLDDLIQTCDFLIIPVKPENQSLEPTLEMCRVLNQKSAVYKVVVVDVFHYNNYQRGHLLLEQLKANNIPAFETLIPHSMKFVDARNNNQLVGSVSGGLTLHYRFGELVKELLAELAPGGKSFFL